MKKRQLVLMVSIVLAVIAAALALLFSGFWGDSPRLAREIPEEIAGIGLGDTVEDSEEMMRMETMMPLRFSPFIREVETVKIPGFDYGLLWIGNCNAPNRILRIRMKYENSSKNFYEEILKRLEKRYGEPKEWRGDPFHAHLAWKWSFLDDEGNEVSMIIEHNVRDPDETSGNTIKLTMWNLVEKEQACYRLKNPKENAKIPNKTDWDLLLPK